MNEPTLRKLLESIAAGNVSVDDAVARLRALPCEATASATIDHHRALRCGFPEVIFSQGKTPEQVADIFSRLAAVGHNVLATRANDAHWQAVQAEHPAAVYDPAARTITLRQAPVGPGGRVAVVAAGTSDLPVAEEARITAEIMDARVSTHYDVGVAGLHRLLAHQDAIAAADAVVVVAGMEGALPSVVGGLIAAPVIGVPTSVGYGASLGGLTALLGMLTSCASGVSVVNIDNGFGAGYIAATIARQAAKGRS